MGAVEVEIERIAKSRVRDALLHLTRDSPRILGVEVIANEASVEEGVVLEVMETLQYRGPFEITPVSESQDVWEVK